jgi:ATP-binding protein involved in chromosome partitioning
MDAAARLRERLGRVLDPELGGSLIELGMVGAVEVDPSGRARIEIALTTAACPLRRQIERDVAEAAREVDGVAEVEVAVAVMDADARRELLRTARALAQGRAPTSSIPAGAPVLAIASGKGGVGKSSVTANLAVALARRGLTVGVLDADVWGFSLTRLLGLRGEIAVRDAKMVPLEQRVGDGSVRLLSMGLLAEEEQALAWRGLMVQKAVAQFIEDADWSGIDYLLIDTPPGTGDIAMTLARILPRMALLVVTTPARSAQAVAARAADLARKSNIRVLGVIENMTALNCSCGRRHALFGEGGGAALAESLQVDLLAQVPLRDDVASGADAGRPVAHDEEDDGDFVRLARRLVDEVAPPLGAASCSARLLDALTQAVAQPSSTS